MLECDGHWLDKPHDRADAREQLKSCAASSHNLVTSAVLVRDDERLWHHTDRAEMRMRDFSDAFLDAYLGRAGDDILRSVGAYQLEGLGAQLFERVSGDFFTILGLPLLPVLAILREHQLVSAGDEHRDPDPHRQEPARRHLRLADRSFALAAAARLLAARIRHRRRLRAVRHASDASWSRAIRALPALGFRGGNITLPHKERALAPRRRGDAGRAKRIGAVNTLVVREDGTILGDNTDGFGFLAHLVATKPDWSRRRRARRGARRRRRGARRRGGAARGRRAGDAPGQPHHAPRRGDCADEIGGPIMVNAVGRARGGAERRRHCWSTAPISARPARRRWTSTSTSCRQRAVVYDIVYVAAETDLLLAARCARQPDRRRHRHAAAPGAARLRGLVRPRAAK